MRFKFGKFLVKFFPPAIVGRNATLLLVRENVFGLASKFNKLSTDKKGEGWKKLSATWSDLGGKPEVLLKEITKGAKKKQILGFDSFDPATIGTAAITSAPIVAKLMSVLKKFGISTDDVTNGLKGLGEQGIKSLMQHKEAKVITDPKTGAETIEIPPHAATHDIPKIEQAHKKMNVGLIAIVVIVAAAIITTGKRQ